MKNPQLTDVFSIQSSIYRGFVITIATAPVLATATVSQIDAWDLRNCRQNPSSTTTTKQLWLEAKNANCCFIPSGYLTYIAMENPQNKWRFQTLGKSSISMGHLYHGYVGHNQRVPKRSDSRKFQVLKNFGQKVLLWKIWLISYWYPIYCCGSTCNRVTPSINGHGASALQPAWPQMVYLPASSPGYGRKNMVFGSKHDVKSWTNIHQRHFFPKKKVFGCYGK